MAGGHWKRKSTAHKNKRRITKARPTAHNQKRQIASAQNQIIAIKQQLNLTKERCRWHCGYVDETIESYPYIVPLFGSPAQSTTDAATTNNPLGASMKWEQTMTSQPQDSASLRSKAVVNKQYVDMSIKSNTEPDVTQFTAFVVQLLPKSAQQVYAETANMSAMTRGRDFVTPTTSLGTDTGYGAFLNNARFKIIKRLEFETAGYDSGASQNNSMPGSTGNTGRGTRTGLVHRVQFKLNYGSTLVKCTGDGQSLSDLQYDEINPEQKRFVVVFSDNSILDAESPSCSLSSLITGYTAE